MKQSLTLTLIIYLHTFIASAQDTMYIHQTDTILKVALNKIDSIIFYAVEENNEITYGSLTDIDNNTYKTVVIGSQEWMAENLAVTKYADGTPIPNVTDNSDWGSLGDNNIDKAYCWYNNDIANKSTYGALYTFASATNGIAHDGSNHVQGVCPTGWHLPSDEEWKQLEMYLGMSQSEVDNTGWRGTDEGTKLKATSGWNSGENGTNDYGFSALPGGRCYYDYGTFGGIGDYGVWWTSTEYDSTRAYGRNVGYNGSYVFRGDYYKSYGFSVRCVRD